MTAVGFGDALFLFYHSGEFCWVQFSMMAILVFVVQNTTEQRMSSLWHSTRELSQVETLHFVESYSGYSMADGMLRHSL